MILKELLITLLQPGKVNIRGPEEEDGETDRPRPELIEMLRGIPPPWLRKAHEIFYGTSTWVMPAGGSIPATKFFLQLSERDLDRIVSMELVFRWKDARSNFEGLGNLRMFEHLSEPEIVLFIYDQPLVRPLVVQIWTRKLLKTKILRLQHLKVDFSQTKDRTGNILSNDILAWNTAPFTHGQPSQLEVVASTLAEEMAILAVIQA